jgi:hypothetical protein
MEQVERYNNAQAFLVGTELPPTPVDIGQLCILKETGISGEVTDTVYVMTPEGWKKEGVKC